MLQDRNDIFTEVMKGSPDERLNKWYTFLESNLKDNGYFLDSGLTYVDFAIFPIVQLIKDKHAAGKCQGVKLPEKIEKWASTMGTLDAIKGMQSSGIPFLPPSMV